MTESKSFHRLMSVYALLAFILVAGCGGGSTGVPPPPLSPDFALNVSPPSATISQGSSTSGIQVGVQPLNGFSGNVQVTLGGLPVGVTTNPQSPFTLQSGANTMLVIGASVTATTGSASISVQAASGSLDHSKDISLTVQSGVATATSRTTYARTDSRAALDDPAGEPHHRHMAYDPANHHLFVANCARNRVDIFLTQDGSRAGSVDVAGASSVDLSADGRTIWVGTLTEQIAAIDTGSLQRSGTFQLSGILALPNALFDRPEEVSALSGGKLLVRMRRANAAESLLALWDPSNNSLADLTPLAPQVFQSGVGVVARSGDHAHILVASNDNSGTAMVLDGNAALLAGAKSLGTGFVTYAAGNADGSRFAVVLTNGNIQQLLLLDASLNTLSSSTMSGARGLLFSRDGKSLDVAAAQNGSSILSVLSATDLHSLGAVTDLTIQGIVSEIEDADETALIFGLNNRGISFVDASQPAAVPASAPLLAIPPSLLPGSGPDAGGTPVTLSGQNFAANIVLQFGGQTATVSSIGATQIEATSPPSPALGATNVTVYFSNGAVVLGPDAFSYGPQVLQILPNAGANSGGDNIAIYGYGFGDDSGKIAVHFGSSAATIQKLEDVTSLSVSLGLDTTYPFPLQRITVTSPPGSAGIADITVNLPSGTSTLKQSFQFLQSEQVFSKAAFYKFILYDRKRQWIYLSNIDRIDVFDLAAGVFRSGILPPGGPPPNALIRQASLTPDASQLVVADFGAQSIYLIDPDTASGSSVNVGAVSGDANSGPVRVAATSAQTVFVGLAGYGGGNLGCVTCLQQMNLSVSPVNVEPAPQPQVSALTSTPLVDASADGSSTYFSFAAATGQPMASWNAATPGQFLTAQTNISSSDIAAAADGTFLASRNANVIELRDANLSLQSVTAESELQGIPQRTNVPGIAMHPSGALIYVPFLTGPAPISAPFTGLQGGVDIVDAHSGRLRLRIILPEPLAMLAADVDGQYGKFLTIDEDGKRIFVITASGLTVVHLAHVPLGIGTVSPSNGPAAGGTTLTIRGSGFQSGVTATLGGKTVQVTFVDLNTIKMVTPALSSGAQRLAFTNSVGETVSWDTAFTAN